VSTSILSLAGQPLRKSAARVRPGVLASCAERAAALMLLLLFAPLLLTAVLLVAILSGQAPLIAHRRVGQGGAEFWMLKIRTMWDGSGGCGGWLEYIRDRYVPLDKKQADPRVTSTLAAFFRKFSVDELPQLLHVLTGKMRLVGPRPVTRQEWDLFYGERATEVLAIPPGITGLWQVRGRNRLTYAQRRRLDLFYVRRRSWRFDLELLARTPVRVLSGSNAG
jgi:lipopolysaccharide/colanic/teichoic acid biosynthesis glycosyltransferase